MIFPRFVLSAALMTPLHFGVFGLTQVAVALPQSEPLPEVPGLIAQQDGSSTTGEDVVERPTLSLGSDGPLVVELQLRLKGIGVYEGEINGSFDALTQAALETFQREYGLEVTGTANPETWEALSSPATAKLAAAIEAEAEAETAETDSDSDESDESETDATVDADGWASRFPQSPRTLAVLGIAIAGLGVGGFGVWRAMGPARQQHSRKSKARKRQPQSLSAAAPPLLTASNASSGATNPSATPSATPSAHASTQTVSPLLAERAEHVTSGSMVPPQDLAGPPSLSIEEEGEAPQTSLKIGEDGKDSNELKPHDWTDARADKQTDKQAVNRPLIPAQNLPAPPPPPPPSSIQRLKEPTPLTPTTRLIRQDVVETLVAQLQSTNPTKRRKAVWELGQRGDSRAIQPLVNLMSVSDSKQRSLILAALSEIGSQTLKPMKRALAMSLQDSNAEVRKNAIRDLTRIYDLVAQISNLLAIATEDEDPEVRDTARWALGQLNRIRSNAGLDQAANQQLLQNSVSPPETMSEDFQLDSRRRETELN